VRIVSPAAFVITNRTAVGLHVLQVVRDHRPRAGSRHIAGAAQIPGAYGRSRYWYAGATSNKWIESVSTESLVLLHRANPDDVEAAAMCRDDQLALAERHRHPLDHQRAGSFPEAAPTLATVHRHVHAVGGPDPQHARLRGLSNTVAALYPRGVRLTSSVQVRPKSVYATRGGGSRRGSGSHT